MRRLHQKKKQPIRFQSLFKVTNQIAGKWKTKSIMWQILKLLFPPQKKRMNVISNRLSTASIKYLNWASPLFEQFQNGYNKNGNWPPVVQFGLKSYLWFQITRTIPAQTALHSVQLPLLTGSKYRKWIKTFWLQPLLGWNTLPRVWYIT